MSKFSRPLFRAGVIFLSLALLISLASALYGFMTPATYRAVNRLAIEPFQADVLQPAFRDSLLGHGSTIRLEQMRNTGLIEVVAEAPASRRAAELANGAAVRMQTILKQRPGIAVQVIDSAEPPFRPLAHSLIALGGGSSAVLGLGAAVLLLLSHFRRRGGREGQYAVG